MIKVLVLTVDDGSKAYLLVQDLHMNSLDRDVMPALNKLVIEEGTFYKRHFCTVAVCCPSRVSLLTGKAVGMFLLCI
jgi:arylsulfatase A-like enzyme